MSQASSEIGDGDKLPVASRRLSPTDVSQYIRLNRCERFLRLRLHERNAGRQFLYSYDVAPQSITPLLTRSGAAFEEITETAIRKCYAVTHFGQTALTDNGHRLPDNHRLLAALNALASGELLVICQPRLQVTLGDWSIRGDADLLRAERDVEGALHLLVTDMKSSTAVSVEHRLQVAFYQAMIAQLLADAGVPFAAIGTAILYRGPADADETDLTLQSHRDEALRLFGVSEAYLEVVADPAAYLAEVESLVTGRGSDADRIASLPFDDLFFSLGLKCDGCLYNEYCMKDAHERGDLAVVPYLPPRDKKSLLRAGVRSVYELAVLKEFAAEDSTDLLPTGVGAEAVRRLAATTAGPRLDELVVRARRSRHVREAGLRTLSYIPSKGHTTLPYSDASHNPNMLRIYIDAQHDYLHDRIYLLGGLVVANENGVPARRRQVVHITDGPPDTAAKEATLFAAWTREVLQAVVELAALDENGQRRAPIHLIFWNDFGQQLLLNALARNMTPMVEAAPALYDFVTQMAAFDSPIATFLDDEIRERKNYPMLCQSLQAISAYLGFPWDETPEGGEDWRKRFHERLFDAGGRGTFDRGGEVVEELYARRSRHNSQIPLEYAYAAWDTLELPPPGEVDPFARYRDVSIEQLLTFQKRRLDAVEWIANDFTGNKLSEKTPFLLPDLSAFEERAAHLARALEEFVTIERHVALTAWKTGRQLPPERRVLLGETLLVRYREEDQEPGVADWNQDNACRRVLKDRHYAEWRAANPGKKQVRLSGEQKAECDWRMAGMPLRLRVETTGVDADLDTVLGLLNIKEGERFVLYPRWTTDERLPEAERSPFTPTPKQMLYGMRVELNRIVVARDAVGRAADAFAEVTVCGPGGTSPGYLFGAIDRPVEADALYTLDSDPNDIYGLWQSKIARALCGLEDAGAPERHMLYHRISRADLVTPAIWPEAAAAGQARFLAGLDAYREASLLHDFESGKRDYIGAHGDDPLLLVQGPPGTGKSYSTAFAVLARMQGALAAGIRQRVFLSCKTHSATDVLLRGVVEVTDDLRRLKEARPDLWSLYFDDRLLSLPLLRVAGGGEGLPASVRILAKDGQRAKGEPCCADDISVHERAIVAATPGGIYGLVKGKWGDDRLFGSELCDLLVLDEASQMSLPEAMMAALPLAPDGRLVVVGDPRQMPPIVQHAWETEPRRTFQEFKAYESLFGSLIPLEPPFIRFAESFRLHAVMARFLRDEVYIRDGIDYHSQRTKVLPRVAQEDPFVAAVLDPSHPLVVVVHEEEESQTRNAFEEALVGPLLRALADPAGHDLSARDGLGVVVPHRAQRLALRQAFPELCVLDQDTGEVLVQAVDTVERYQGDERDVILISATESDPEYLQGSAGFLLDPRRLTVALSRAKKKMVLIASRTIFTYFSGEEEMFLRAQIWKNLLRRACATPLWQGECDGRRVRVWGSGD